MLPTVAPASLQARQREGQTGWGEDKAAQVTTLTSEPPCPLPGGTPSEAKKHGNPEEPLGTPVVSAGDLLRPRGPQPVPHLL